MAGPVANLPNALTGLRFLLSFVFFGALGLKGPLWMSAALALFVGLGITDLLDGYLARKRGEETAFGRVADPFVDKVLVCGAFVFLLVRPEMTKPFRDGGVGLNAWMVVLILAREFLVTALRGYVEAAGKAFGATWTGKTKMAIQFACLCAALLYLGHPNVFPWEARAMAFLLWTTVAMTVASSVTYVARFLQLVRSGT